MSRTHEQCTCLCLPLWTHRIQRFIDTSQGMNVQVSMDSIQEHLVQEAMPCPKMGASC